jgi:hypothetical protein
MAHRGGVCTAGISHHGDLLVPRRSAVCAGRPGHGSPDRNSDLHHKACSGHHSCLVFCLQMFRLLGFYSGSEAYRSAGQLRQITRRSLLALGCDDAHGPVPAFGPQGPRARTGMAPDARGHTDPSKRVPPGPHRAESAPCPRNLRQRAKRPRLVHQNCRCSLRFRRRRAGKP